MIHQHNQGGSIARNKGIEKASGKYIYFFDSDDHIFPGILEKAITSICTYDEDILVDNVKQVDERGHVRIKRPYFIQKHTTDKRELFFIDSNPGNKIYRKSIIDKCQIRFADVRIIQELNF